MMTTFYIWNFMCTGMSVLNVLCRYVILQELVHIKFSHFKH